MRVYRVLSQNIVSFAYFYRGMVNNKRCSWEEIVRGTQGSLKKWSESLNKCEKSGKKAKYAVFCGSDQAARKCFERGRYMTVNSRSGNLRATILIHVCCHDSN